MFSLVSITIDGKPKTSHELTAESEVFGRSRAEELAADPFLSPEHFVVSRRGEKLFVRDRGSLNGLFRKLRAAETVRGGDGFVFRVGREVLRFEHLAEPQPTADGVELLGADPGECVGRLVVVHGRESTGNAYLVPAAGLVVGRERGDVLFPDDAFVSGTHCRIDGADGEISLTDLGSSNGTYVKLDESVEVSPGEVILAGLQLFRISSNRT